MTHVVSILRRLASERGFTVVCVLTLAVGIGVNVAVFSLAYGVVLKPLPYPGAERLVSISHAAPKLDLDDMDVSEPLYRRYKEQATTFEEMAMYRDGRVSLTGLDVPERLRHGTATASLFSVLGVSPLMGRVFGEEDEKPGALPVVLIGEKLWRGRFGATSDILGRKIEVDGRTRDIVGVMPARFEIPREADLWLPLIQEPDAERLGNFTAQSIARLKPGVSLDAALADLKRFTDGIVEQFPDQHAAAVLARSGFKPFITPLLDDMVGETKRVLFVLWGAVGFVLLMVCANVANVFLVRAESRRRELALRVALGASRSRILSEFLIEGLVLALVGGGLGVVLADRAVRSLIPFAPEGIPRLDQVSVEGPVIAFALVLALASAILFALLPGLHYGRPGDAAALKDGGRGSSAGRGRVRVRRALVALQLAMAIILLVGAGLMVRSFRELARVRPGFGVHGALTLRMSLPGSQYGSPEKVAAFLDRLVERLSALPEVSAVGAVNNLPLSGSANGAGHSIEDFPLGEKDLPPVFIRYFASPGYREAMRIPLLEGRWFEPADHQQRSGAAVVSESVAKQYWPNGSAIGRRIWPGRAGGKWYTIVGVVGNIRHGLEDEPSPSVYYPLVTFEGEDGMGPNIGLVLRAPSSPESLGNAARSAVWEIDRNVPITQVLPLEQLVRDARAPMAFSMFLLVVASVIAVLLGVIGIYGVVSYVVSQRTQEIGVRMALGAEPGKVRAMVLRDGLATSLPGVAVGVAGAFALTRFLKSVLFGVSPFDPATFALVAAFLLTVAVMSSFVPALRASRVDPVEALRQE